LDKFGQILLDANNNFGLSEALLNEAKSTVLDLMGKAKYGYIMRDGKKVVIAHRQSRGRGKPWLVVKGNN
jgi:hypothetical protein